MNTQHRAIREMLRAMAPNRARSYIAAFGLPEEEAACLIECDVRKQSHVQAGEALHLSTETVKRRRRAALAHIADEINHMEEAP